MEEQGPPDPWGMQTVGRLSSTELLTGTYLPVYLAISLQAHAQGEQNEPTEAKDRSWRAKRAQHPARTQWMCSSPPTHLCTTWPLKGAGTLTGQGADAVLSERPCVVGLCHRECPQQGGKCWELTSDCAGGDGGTGAF